MTIYLIYGDNQRKEKQYMKRYSQVSITPLREVLMLLRHSWLQLSFRQFAVKVSKCRFTQSWESVVEARKIDNVCECH